MTVVAGAGTAGPENLGRLKSRLRRHPAAMAALRAIGLNGATVDRLHLGLKEPYKSRREDLEIRDAVCFPTLGEGLRAGGRYAYLNLDGVTVNPQHRSGWGPGPSLVYRLGSFLADAVALVSADVVDAWVAWQLSRGGHPDVAFVSRTHPGGWPVEWRSPDYWSGFARVVVLPGEGAADFLAEIAPRMGRAIERIRLDGASTTLAAVTAAGGAPSLDALLGSAELWVEEVPDAVGGVPVDRLGRFRAAPVSVTGAFSGGRLYYPVAVESRKVERHGRSERLVQSYETMVVRSDGRLLVAEALPAPRGASADQRILALSDGTRIADLPAASRTGSWSFASIERFVGWRASGGEAPFRPLPEMMTDIEAFLASRAWLPDTRHGVVPALYVLLSHVFQVFDAVPLLLLLGGRASGKSELGEAIARLSFNATVAGQLRAAGMIRLLDETRGLLVLDDMDGDGQASVSGNGELAQALKTSYKRSTSLKPVADRGGRVRMVDFFGPKVISRTRPVDPVLGSRMVAVPMAAMPAGTVTSPAVHGEEALDAMRDELHCWAMVTAPDVRAAYLAVVSRTDRRDEICAPLRALAGLCGGDWPARLETALSDPATHG